MKSETMLRQIRVTRYVTPLGEGGSLPAIVEALTASLINNDTAAILATATSQPLTSQWQT